MSTEFINDQWRIPNAWNGTESNVNKQSNYSLSFDGSSQYISLSTDIFDFGSNAFSFSGWVKRTSIGDSTNVILFIQKSGTTPTMQIRQNARNIKVDFNVGSTWSFVETTTNPIGNDTNWHHLAVTRSGTSMSIYFDGVLQDTGTAPATLDAGNDSVFIGSRGALSQFWNGSIDAVSIYNYELSSSQITTLYGSSSTGIGNPMSLSPKPVAYYPLGDQDAFNGADYLVPNSSLKDYVFDFNGNDDITVSHNSYFDQSVYSFSFWINNNLNSGVSNDGIITADSTTRGWSMLQDNQTFKFNPNISGGSGQINVTNFFNTTSTWIHCAITFDGTNLIIYKNGTSVGSLSSGTRNLNSNNNPLTIGNNTFASGRFFNGKLSNVQIFSTALPATGSNSVETLYNNGSPLTSMSGYSSLVGWWKLDASATYDSSTNTWSIPDDSTNSNTGTSSGMTQANLVQSDLSFTSGYSPYALDFDGTNDYIDCGDSDDFSFGDGTNDSPFSYSTWVNMDDATSFVLFSKYPDDNAHTKREYRIFISNADKPYLLLYDAGTTSTINYRVAANAITSYQNQWINLTFTYDGRGGNLAGDGIKIYLNGSSIALDATISSSYVSMHNTSTPARIGRTLTSYANGKISNCSLWSTELTSAQVTELYNEGVPSNLNNHSAYSNLVSWWQLGSNSSFNTNWTVLDEVTASGNNGTSVNMTEADIVGGVGSYANGLSSGMGGDEVIGSAPFSDANSLSVNMDVLDRVEDTPS